MSNNTISIRISALDEASKTLQRVGSNISQWAKDNEKTFTNMRNIGGVAFGALSAWILKFADDGAKLVEVRDAFGRLTKWIWEDSVKILEALKKSSKGAIDDKNIMLSANKAMSLWVAKNTEEFTTLMDIARTKAKNMGLTTQQAFDDIVTGLGRWSPMILDNLGITIKLWEAQEKYAKILWKTVEQMSDQEKKQALINAVVSEGKKEMQEMWEIEMTLAEKKQYLNAQFTNMKNTLGEALLPLFSKLMEIVSPIIEKGSEWINQNPQLAQTILVVVTAIAGLVAVIGVLWLALPWIIAWLWLLTWPIWLIALAVGALGVAWATNFWWIQEKTKALYDTVQPIFQAIWETISTTFMEIWNIIKDTWEQITGKTTESTQSMETTFYAVFIAITEIVKFAVETIAVLIKWIVTVLSWIVMFLKWAFTGDWSLAWEWIKQIFAGVWNSLAWLLDVIFPWIIDKIKWFVDSVIESFLSLWEWIKNVVSWAFDWVSSKIDWAINKAKQAASTIASLIWWGGWDSGGNRATGWPVIAGRPYTVWEMWREIFIPSTNGTIVPTNKIWGGGITINMWDVHIKDNNDLDYFLKEVENRISRASSNSNLYAI